MVIRMLPVLKKTAAKNIPEQIAVAIWNATKSGIAPVARLLK